MEKIKLLIKGFIIGVGKILPGVSGALMAITLGVYEKGMNAIINIFNKDNFYFLMYLGIGFIISVVTMSNILIFFIKNYYFWTMLLFVGLIIGGLKEITNVIKDEITIINVIYMSIPAIILLIINKNMISFNLPYNFITMFFLGMIESFTMIVPGISGTVIYIMLGSYKYVIRMFSGIIIKDLIPFVIGALIFTILFIKVLLYLLKKHKISLYYVILGFSISSIIYLVSTLNFGHNLYEYVIGIILFIIGFKISDKMSA